MKCIAHVYDENGVLFASYVLVIPTDEPAVLRHAALSYAIEDGLDMDRARKCRVEFDKSEEDA
jgi:hypothetical protein